MFEGGGWGALPCHDHGVFSQQEQDIHDRRSEGVLVLVDHGFYPRQNYKNCGAGKICPLQSLAGQKAWVSTMIIRQYMIRKRRQQKNTQNTSNGKNGPPHALQTPARYLKLKESSSILSTLSCTHGRQHAPTRKTMCPHRDRILLYY